MVYLHEILDTELLEQHIKNGLVTERLHESLPLAIYNYTPECQFSRAWDDVTKKCRGLIVNYNTFEVIARPFEKFFNWDEGGSPFPPSGPALRMEKMDGSLGILYRAEGLGQRVDFWDNYRIATRGSMHSEQAEWATKFMREARITHPERWVATGNPDFDSYNGCHPATKGPATDFYAKYNKTYLFEIIYPENRIVVDYGEYKGLVLIDVIDNETGFSDTDEFDNCAWPDKVRRMPVQGFDSGQCQDIPEGDEGFVYLWPTRNFRTKMKSAQYVYLHRLVSNLNEKTIWEMLVAGKTITDIKKDLPEEFHDFVDKTGGAILKNVSDLLNGLMVEIVDVEKRLGVDMLEQASRKDIAMAIKNSPYRKYIFNALDGKSNFDVMLKDSKPVKASKTAAEKEAA